METAPLLLSFLFGTFGLGYFVYGKKQVDPNMNIAQVFKAEITLEEMVVVKKAVKVTRAVLKRRK
jgi:hypothetical protein